MNLRQLLKSIIFSLSIVFFGFSSIYGQGTGTLRAFISDSSTGEALAFCNVIVEELQRGASTNENGYAVITGIKGNLTYSFLVSYVGYKSARFKAYISPNKVTEVKVLLQPSSVQLQTVEKVGEKIIEKNETDVGLKRINVKELEFLPQSVELDIFRSIQVLPGVQSTSDISAKYYVRGGGGDQNLVLYNGATIYNPFHAFGMFSSVDPEILSNIEFYKGGFTSEYGGRISSVMNLITKNGNKNRFSGRASVSQLTAKVLVEGPIPNGSFVVTGRKSYSNAIFKKFLNNRIPPIDFYDYSFKLNTNPSFLKGSTWTLFGFFSNDIVDNESQFDEDFNWSNNIIGFKWYQVGDSPLFYEITMCYSGFNGEVIPNFSGTNPKKNELKDFTTKMDFTYIFNSKDELDLGLHIADIKTSLFLVDQNGLKYDVSANGTNFAFYAKYRMMRFENFGLDLGVRSNMTGLSKGGIDTFEPRVSTTWNVFPFLKLKGAIGIYQQQVVTYSDENEVISLFEPWTITPEYLKASKATHYIGGLSIAFLTNLSLDIEGYIKKMENLISLNEQKYRSGDKDFVSGPGESYGWEGTLKYNNDLFRCSAAYSLSWAYKEIDGKLYYPKYDTRHSVTLDFEMNLGAGWSTSLVWNFHTGNPFTQNMGYYDKLYFSNLFLDTDFNDNYIPYAVLADKNLGRLPDYHRLDFNISKHFDYGFVKGNISGSILNVYNRKNLFYFKRESGEKVYMLPFLPSVSVKVEL